MTWIHHNLRLVVVAAFWIMVALFGYLAYDHYTWNPTRAEKREIRSVVEESAQIAADESSRRYVDLTDQFYETGDVNTRDLYHTLMPRANKARDIKRIYEAANARVEGADEAVLSAEYNSGDGIWVALEERQIRVPSIIKVTGQVRPGWFENHASGPDGIPWQPERPGRSRTVLMHERGLNLPTAETGNLNEAMIRLCETLSSGCRLGVPVGSEAALCVGPGYYDGGYVHGGHNGLWMVGKVVAPTYFNDRGGADTHLRFLITPDDPATGRTPATQICNANPGRLAVKLSEIDAGEDEIVEVGE